MALKVKRVTVLKKAKNIAHISMDNAIPAGRKSFPPIKTAIDGAATIVPKANGKASRAPYLMAVLKRALTRRGSPTCALARRGNKECIMASGIIRKDVVNLKAKA